MQNCGDYRTKSVPSHILLLEYVKIGSVLRGLSITILHGISFAVTV